MLVVSMLNILLHWQSVQTPEVCTVVVPSEGGGETDEKSRP